MPRILVIILMLACILPFLLNLVGFDFGSPGHSLDSEALKGLEDYELNEAMFNHFNGAFTHTLLEWTAFAVALFTVILAFAQYRFSNDITIPVIGVALFCSGCVDAFHTLAADRLIHGTADNRNLIPFTLSLIHI